MTLHLLTDELVALNEIGFESISHETVRQCLKNALQPHLYDYWAIPADQGKQFIYGRMSSISTTNHTTRTG
jgi:hypothetical protein